MSRIARFIALLLLSSLLISCQTLKQPKNDGDDDPDLKLQTAKINTQLGIAYLERHNIQRAKQKLLLALEEAPNTPEPWYAMGYFLEATGNKMDARTYYLRSVEISPERGDVQNNYGTYLCRRGNYQAAITHFMLAVKDHHYLDSADAYENAGMCAMKIPNYRAARKFFHMALLEDPSKPNALIGLAELDYRIGSYHAASRQLSAFLTLSPATTQSNHLGNLIEQKLAASATTTVAYAAPVKPIKAVTIAVPIKKTQRILASKKPAPTPLLQPKMTTSHPKTISMNKIRPIQNKKLLISSINKLLESKKQPTLSSKKSKIEVS